MFTQTIQPSGWSPSAEAVLLLNPHERLFSDTMAMLDAQRIWLISFMKPYTLGLYDGIGQRCTYMSTIRSVLYALIVGHRV